MLTSSTKKCQKAHPAAPQIDAGRAFARAMPSVGAQIFFASARAVLPLFIIGGMGVMARKKGWLNASTASALAKLNGKFFLPCLLWTSLSRTVTAGTLRELWIMPVLAMMHVVIGSAIGYYVVLRACGTRRGFRTVTVLSCGFGNSLALPVVISRAITKNPTIGDLVFVDPDDGDKCALYLSVYVIMLSLLMWSLGPYLYHRRVALEESAGEGVNRVNGDAENAGMRDAAHSSDVERESSAAGDTTLTNNDDTKHALLGVARNVFNANVNACLLGILTGICTPVRDIIFQPGRAFSYVGYSADSLADAAIPSILLIIGCSLANGPDYKMADKKSAIAVLITRFIIIPFITIGLYYGLKDAGVAPTNHVFWLSFLLLGATPTANNVMLQAQMFHSDENAIAGVGTLLLYQYAVVPVVLVGWISWFLAIV
jgi:auxin efflux carrier family protein